MKLFLSVGHSGGKVGAAAWGTTEFSECEKIARAAAKLISPIIGNNLIMVPIEFDIMERCAFINAQCAPDDIAIELHMDSGTTKSSGCGLYYGNEKAKKIANQIMQNYKTEMGIPLRFFDKHTDSRFGQIGIVKHTKCDTYLIELGFISNKDELELMRKKSSTAIANALRNTLFPTFTVHVSSWAEEAAKKAQKKEYMTSWINPQEVMTDTIWQHLFHNMNVLDEVDESKPLTRERVAVILDRLHLLD